MRPSGVCISTFLLFYRYTIEPHGILYTCQDDQITPQQATQQRAKFSGTQVDSSLNSVFILPLLLIRYTPACPSISVSIPVHVSRTSPHPATAVRVGSLTSGMTGPQHPSYLRGVACNNTPTLSCIMHQLYQQLVRFADSRIGNPAHQVHRA